MPRLKKRGYYGEFGGQYVPETLVAALHELEESYEELRSDAEFNAELNTLLRDLGGRLAEGLTAEWGGARVYLKREDLNHTGAHKINNCIGQALLARRLGKKRIVAETGAGQHGTATAAACARLGLQCVVYMGTHDMQRQQPNVDRMRLLGAEVLPVEAGLGTLKEATSEAIRDWVANVRDTHYIIGSTVGPHPYPRIVKEFQSVIGMETKEQILEREGQLPETVVACVGGGSNAMGIFAEFINEKDVKLVGVESAGEELSVGKHAAPLALGRPGVLHGSRTYVLQNEDGQIELTTTLSAGLDYPGVGPEHSYLKESGRVEYVSVTDRDAVAAFKLLCRREGIIPALESSYALAHAARIAEHASGTIVVNLSGRGDKDLQSVTNYDKNSSE